MCVNIIGVRGFNWTNEWLTKNVVGVEVVLRLNCSKLNSKTFYSVWT